MMSIFKWTDEVLLSYYTTELNVLEMQNKNKPVLHFYR